MASLDVYKRQDSICIKDMAGLLVPNEATRLVTALKQATDIPICLLYTSILVITVFYGI